jgi:hypothetical protein
MNYRLAPLFLLAVTVLSAEDLYVADSATGSDNGANCANAHSRAWFNTAANWGGGAGEIDPGDTVHLCGTFTGTAGSAWLTTQAAGSEGNPITILFESGAIMSAPYWGTNDGTNPTGGAITLAHSYTAVDGGTNGIIENTASGTGLTYSGASAPITGGVVITTCSTTCEVRNLTIRKVYLKTPYSADPLSFGVGDKSYGVFTTFQARSNISIHDNRISDAIATITLTYTTGANYRVFNNTLSRTCAGVAIGDGNDGHTLDGLYVYNNDISGGFVWWDPDDNCHINGMHLWAAHVGSSIANLQVYNNYIHGNMAGGCGVANCYSHVTSFVFVEGTGGGTITSPLMFNNLLVAANDEGDGGSNGLLSCSTACTNPGIYNNTLIGQVAHGIVLNGATGVTIKNNIIVNFDAVLYMSGGATMTAANNNLYNSWVSGWTLGGSTYGTFSNWQAQGWDANGSVTAVNLDSNYRPASGSPAIGLGANLTSVGVAALSLDRSGVTRPSSGAWDTGAYQVTTGSTSGGPRKGRGPKTKK